MWRGSLGTRRQNRPRGHQDPADEEEELDPPFKLRSIVGSLPWFAMATRPDIAYPRNAVTSSLEKQMK